MDQLNPHAWTGRTERAEGSVTPMAASLIGATLDRDENLKIGDPLPPLWHWCAFPETVASKALGADGHPPLGDFLPISHLRRRMWAGGNLRFHAPIYVGDPLNRVSTIANVEEKQGATGPMLLVTVDRQTFGPLGLAVQEQQTIVYLEIPQRYHPPKQRPLPDRPLVHETYPMTEPVLFRFSAVTFNAHRIHYDLAYAKTVEHYPGLVVHGPLQAMLLVGAASRHAGRPPSEFQFTGVHPMFAGTDLDLMACDAEDGGLDLFTGQNGYQGMRAHALWEGTL